MITCNVYYPRLAALPAGGYDFTDRPSAENQRTIKPTSPQINKPTNQDTLPQVHLRPFIHKTPPPAISIVEYLDPHAIITRPPIVPEVKEVRIDRGVPLPAFAAGADTPWRKYVVAVEKLNVGDSFSMPNETKAIDCVRKRASRLKFKTRYERQGTKARIWRTA